MPETHMSTLLRMAEKWQARAHRAGRDTTSGHAATDADLVLTIDAGHKTLVLRGRVEVIDDEVVNIFPTVARHATGVQKVNTYGPVVPSEGLTVEHATTGMSVLIDRVIIVENAANDYTD